MTIRVNGLLASPHNAGNDWESVLDTYLLALPVDDFKVGATISIRHVGTLGDAPRQPAPWRPSELGYPYPDLVIPYEFGHAWGKTLVVRNYRLARVNGASRPAAKWVAIHECQRLMAIDTSSDQWSHLATRHKDTREECEIESDNADEAVRLLNDSTSGGFWEWEDGELWLIDYDDLEDE